LPMVCSIGSWADAGGSLSLDGADARLATPFHVLVGGWAFLAVVGWLALRRKTHFVDIVSGVDSSNLLSSECVYCLAGGEQLFTPTPTGSVQPLMYGSATASPPEPLVLVLKLVDRLGVPAGTSA